MYYGGIPKKKCLNLSCMLGLQTTNDFVGVSTLKNANFREGFCSVNLDLAMVSRDIHFRGSLGRAVRVSKNS